MLRGDTAFSQSERLDAWDANGVTFYFGFKAMPNLVEIADNLPQNAWQKLLREPRYEVQTEARQRPTNVKQRIIRRRGFEVLRLQGEDYAEFDYTPTECQQSYRMIVLRKHFARERRDAVVRRDSLLFLHRQRLGDRRRGRGVRGQRPLQSRELDCPVGRRSAGVSAPVDNLYSNWAYMVMTSLAWNLKSWWALCLPEDGRWGEEHRAQKHEVLRMEFKTFLNAFIKIPCQIVRTGRQLIYRVLNYNPHLSVFFRLYQTLRC